VNKGSTLVLSPLRNKEEFLTVEEMTIGTSEAGIGGVNMGECMTKMVVERLSFLIIPLIHRAKYGLLGVGSGSGGVRVGFECYPPRPSSIFINYTLNS
jgi:hypothetical protein